jgi:hypothetical protein
VCVRNYTLNFQIPILRGRGGGGEAVCYVDNVLLICLGRAIVWKRVACVSQLRRCNSEFVSYTEIHSTEYFRSEFPGSIGTSSF